jgi:hypothetical protein
MSGFASSGPEFCFKKSWLQDPYGRSWESSAALVTLVLIIDLRRNEGRDGEETV